MWLAVQGDTSSLQPLVQANGEMVISIVSHGSSGFTYSPNKAGRTIGKLHRNSQLGAKSEPEIAGTLPWMVKSFFFSFLKTPLSAAMASRGEV